MLCPGCGTAHEGEYCPHCGLQAASAAASAAAPAVAPVVEAVPAAAAKTDVVWRAGAFLIDVVPALLVASAVGSIPVVGSIVLGFVLLDYWLLRDFTGSSLGKYVVGLQVVNKDGSASSLQARMLRNLTLAAGPALLIVPIVSEQTAWAITGILLLIEITLLIMNKERLGDTLAATTVVRKATEKKAGNA